MTKQQVIDWVKEEFDKFDERTQDCSKECLKIYGDHYKNIALTAIEKITDK